MTCPWENPPTGHAADAAMRIAAGIPVIETARLRLRAPAIEDFAAYAGIVLSDRWKDEGGETREDAWLDFNQMVAGWLLRGTGLMSVESREDGTLLGFVVLNHEYGDPELELGWFLTADAEGQGYATEAAMALRDHASHALGLTGLVSYIAPDNARSARVAERLGAGRDRAAERAFPDPVLVYRHPAPGAA